MITFATDVAPLFRQKDILCMGNMDIRLNEYEYMSNPDGDNIHPSFANLRHVIAHLLGEELPRMPPGGPYWSDEKVGILRKWLEDGCNP
jgi:hypothetical protein